MLTRLSFKLTEISQARAWGHGSGTGWGGVGGGEGVQFIYTRAKDGVKAEGDGECYVPQKKARAIFSRSRGDC